MATYVVHYKLQGKSSSTSGSKSVQCETERSAIEAAKGQALATHPDRSFILLRVDKKG
jgi:hypothetical protein